MTDPEWLGIRGAAHLLGVHENTVRKWIEEGVLQARTLPSSGYRRVSRASVQAVLDARAPAVQVQRCPTCQGRGFIQVPPA